MSFRKPKILILGAGSFFTNFWIKDIALIPGLEGGTFALVDVNSERLQLTFDMTKKILEKLGKKWVIKASLDREELMPNTDYLINTIEVSGLETVKHDYEIPKKYGVDQCIGDTIGPGGIMKALRTIPVWLEILRDTERLCPNALVLNYTNPMSMMVLAAEMATDLPVIGLCHSVQSTSKQLAEYVGIPYEKMEWECAGINHMAWFTKLGCNGQDLYSILRGKAQDPEFYQKDPVRFEILLQFGYFPTESSGHFSEYVPYFRKRPELINRYCGEGYKGESGFYANNWPKWSKALDDLRKRWIAGQEITEEDLQKSNLPTTALALSQRSDEYASYIVEAHLNGNPAIIHGNVLNQGLIDNLPQGVVEVPVVVDKTGLHPCKFGILPPQLAALNRSCMAVHELCVKSILESDREAAIQAMMLDPLTAAVCSLAEVRKMATELFEAEKRYIPGYLTSNKVTCSL
ncbi:alpha-galactosidase [Candidatus Hakubella thermalkaliphila]|uniref:Alpha-galactosidase n=2 Tax=Candidatus Hakubella thermalkaliphila TaxID=2754717 RepID=A0A6V8QFD1_9ACTN|nr:alpha-galactosidase [Candidatus Hakubella thermalkaliphila]GFP28064.1 alpha-galactosidase [Candidatus Hakubella thermalkaliphila]GFP35229.1 alpha-galactosidase [Candidatus Hakubella thermalkaliphila]GFP41491.1 alpha-galactosidase [Candidatus Hakubella thermalkaliphila]